MWHTGSFVAACELLVVAYGLSSSLTKDQPQTPSIGTTESQPLAQEGSPINLISEGRCGSPRNWFKVLSSNILPNSLITSYAGLENKLWKSMYTQKFLHQAVNPVKPALCGRLVRLPLSLDCPLVETVDKAGSIVHL